MVEALVRLMATADSLTGPVNLGNPAEFTILELAEKVISLIKSKSKLVRRPRPSDDPMQRKPDIALPKKRLHWMPRTQIDAGLLATIRYFGRSSLLRAPLALIPKSAVVTVRSGINRGRKWIVGSNTHGCWLGHYERQKQELIGRLVKPGMTVFDVGANAGFYTLALSSTRALACAGVDDHHWWPGVTSPAMTVRSRVPRVTQLHLWLLTGQITEHRVQCGPRLGELLRARYK